MTRLKPAPTPAARPNPSANMGGLAEASVPLPWSSAMAGRLSDYWELTKPRIAVMVLVSVTVGFLLASRGTIELPLLAHSLVGIALMAAGSSALNQFWERNTDRLMPRTANRPLPSRRLAPKEVFAFGIATGLLGAVYLATLSNVLTAVLTGTTLLTYVCLYTPMKRTSAMCTTVGAIPGALPPVLGWTAAGGELNLQAASLFGILFLWQFPHFLAIGWLYREQYAKAGLKMLPTHRPGMTGFLATAYAVVLLPMSLLPTRFDLAGNAYFLTALVLGAGYLLCSVRFMLGESQRTARGLLWSSLLYLPLLLFSLTWDHFRLLQ